MWESFLFSLNQKSFLLRCIFLLNSVFSSNKGRMSKHDNQKLVIASSDFYKNFDNIVKGIEIYFTFLLNVFIVSVENSGLKVKNK